MSNFDDIFEGQSSGYRREDKTFDKEAWAAKKQAERKDVYALADSTAEAIKGDGNKFRDYLDVQSRFDRYSATNALLILLSSVRTRFSSFAIDHRSCSLPLAERFCSNARDIRAEMPLAASRISVRAARTFWGSLSRKEVGRRVKS